MQTPSGGGVKRAFWGGVVLNLAEWSGKRVEWSTFWRSGGMKAWKGDILYFGGVE